MTVGPLRTRLLGAARVLTDAVICGHNQQYVGALGMGQPGRGAGRARRQRDRSTTRAFAAHLPRHSLTGEQAAGARTLRVERLLLLTQPPSLDAGEITDKGYLNQRACLGCRAAEVARLYGAVPEPDVIVLGGDAERRD